jgi:hypothetical protein
MHSLINRLPPLNLARSLASSENLPTPATGTCRLIAVEPCRGRRREKTELAGFKLYQTVAALAACATGLFFRNGIGRLSVLTEGNTFAGGPVVSNDEIVVYWRRVCFGARMKSNDVALMNESLAVFRQLINEITFHKNSDSLESGKRFEYKAIPFVLERSRCKRSSLSRFRSILRAKRETCPESRTEMTSQSLQPKLQLLEMFPDVV